MGQENVLNDILERKNGYLCFKNKKFKKSKVDIFPKGLIRGYNQKMAIFPTFLFKAIQARKISFKIFQKEKTLLQALKKRSLKRRKIHIFPKELTHVFGPIMVIFLTLFLQAIQATKMSFTIFQNEKTPFQAIKRRSSKSQKTSTFFQRG